MSGFSCGLVRTKGRVSLRDMTAAQALISRREWLEGQDFHQSQLKRLKWAKMWNHIFNFNQFVPSVNIFRRPELWWLTYYCIPLMSDTFLSQQSKASIMCTQKASDLVLITPSGETQSNSSSAFYQVFAFVVLSELGFLIWETLWSQMTDSYSKTIISNGFFLKLMQILDCRNTALVETNQNLPKHKKRSCHWTR